MTCLPLTISGLDGGMVCVCEAFELVEDWDGPGLLTLDVNIEPDPLVDTGVAGLWWTGNAELLVDRCGVRTIRGLITSLGGLILNVLKSSDSGGTYGESSLSDITISDSSESVSTYLALDLCRFGRLEWLLLKGSVEVFVVLLMSLGKFSLPAIGLALRLGSPSGSFVRDAEGEMLDSLGSFSSSVLVTGPEFFKALKSFDLNAKQCGIQKMWLHTIQVHCIHLLNSLKPSNAYMRQ